MKRPSLHRLKHYAMKCLGLRHFFQDGGDGRLKPRKPARTLLWALLAGQWLRETSFFAIEQLVSDAGPRKLGLQTSFGDDTLSYFTERLDPARTRQALIDALHRAKRNKAFENSRSIGLAVDGTTVGRCRESGCAWCRSYRNAEKQIVGYKHHLAMISVVGAGLSLPFDIEPYGPKDSEYAAGQRLLRRASAAVGPRFADYLVVDAEYATSTFLHAATDVGLPVIARLKDNLPELAASVKRRFDGNKPQQVLQDGADRIEFWDEEDFSPWETLQWERVRVIRYRQHHPDGTVVEAEWLTNLSQRKFPSLSLYRMARSRWEIENEGFNDCKSRQGLEHICHHHTNSLLIGWLLTLLALVIGRLYRIRFLHRGKRSVTSAVELVRLLWLALGTKPHCRSG
jgi:Transposase DDE domain